MKPEFVDILRWLSCSGIMTLDKAGYVGDRVESSMLTCTGCAEFQPIIDYIPRFVPSENYANTFGFQWKKFAKTQLGSLSGHPISRERFFHTTERTPEAMKGKWVLDVGCGAGSVCRSRIVIWCQCGSSRLFKHGRCLP